MLASGRNDDMNAASLSPCTCGAGLGGITVANPPMNYDVTLGTPTAQGITPPFTNLPAHIDEINGAGAVYTWSQVLGAWKQI